MAKSAKYRTLTTIDGTEMIFFPKGFKNTVNERIEMDKRAGVGTTQASLFESMSGQIHKSVEAIRNYYKGYNGPDDFETLQCIATFLAVSVMNLLRPKHVDVPVIEPMSD